MVCNFVFSFRVRKAVLEASLRGRKDFQAALLEFISWLGTIEAKVAKLDSEASNKQAIKDTKSRMKWLNVCKVSWQNGYGVK